jgi:hypothetical protein
VGGSVSPYIDAYPWTGSGFGTKYADPSSLPGSAVVGVAFSPDSKYLAFAETSSPFIGAYEWDGGFGTRFSDPATLPEESSTTSGAKPLSWYFK